MARVPPRSAETIGQFLAISSTCSDCSCTFSAILDSQWCDRCDAFHYRIAMNNEVALGIHWVVMPGGLVRLTVVVVCLLLKRFSQRWAAVCVDLPAPLVLVV